MHIEDGMDLADLAVQMCDRGFGVGGDGLLAVAQAPDGLTLRMFNPDGTEDFCGNGLRCAARHANSLGWVGEAFTIHHYGRDVAVEIEGDLFSTGIGSASYRPEDIPVQFSSDPSNTFDRVVFEDGPKGIRGSALTTGSTHTVIPGPLPIDEEILRLGPLIENAPQFPIRTSVIWVEEVSPMILKIRIWERGVGETFGCGTGSSAAAVDYMRRQGVSGKVEVRNPGGTVWIMSESWDAGITVMGEAREVYAGVLAP